MEKKKKKIIAKEKSVVKKRKKKNKPLLRNILFFLAALCLTFAFFYFKQSNSLLHVADNDSYKGSLQLGTFKTPTPSPTPQAQPPTETPTPEVYSTPTPVDNGTCVPNAWITGGCTCTGVRQIWVYCDDTQPPTPPQPARGCIIYPGNDAGNTICRSIINEHPECRQWCEMKPIIYLYPLSPTFVDVSISTPGKIYVSDPLYPEGGWKNVLAFPSGKLLYNGGSYNELFYEIDHKDLQVPKDGIVLSLQTAESEMRAILGKYGLNSYETSEFLKFWMPKIISLKKPYIFFSVFPKEVKDKMDKITVSPEPQTRIEVIAYFKGLDEKIPVQKLLIPENPPARTGFIMTAWGGIMEKN